MSNKCKKYLAWFIAGQAVQLIAHLLARVSWMNKPVLFCLAAGFLILVAVGVGMFVAGQEKQTPKSYRDWAEPEVDLHD